MLEIASAWGLMGNLLNFTTLYSKNVEIFVTKWPTLVFLLGSGQLGAKETRLVSSLNIHSLCIHFHVDLICLSQQPLSSGRDLKRDVAKKLEKLEKRTQKAIAELISEYDSKYSD